MFVTGFRGVRLHLLPISGQYYPVSNRLTVGETGPLSLDKNGHVSLMVHEYIHRKDFSS